MGCRELNRFEVIDLQKLQRMFMALMLVCMLLFSGTAYVEDGNLIKNGSFEQLDSDGLPSEWYTDAYVNRVGVSAYSVTDEARTGNVAAVVQNFDSNDARFAQRVKVEPNTMYRLSGYIKASEIPDAGRGANLSIDGVYVFSDSVFDSAGEWRYVELYGETDDAQKEVTVFVRLGGYSGESMGTAAFDDIRLEKVEELPDGLWANAWYSVPQTNVIQPIAEEEEVVPDAAWPWLLAIACGYTVAAGFVLRHLQLNRQEEALRETARQRGCSVPAMPVFAIVGMVIAALLRMAIALNIEGYQVDVNCFTAWGNTMASVGPSLFYQSNWCDYTPAYVYIMGLNGALARVLSPLFTTAFVHKIIPMACDLVGAWLVWRLAFEKGYTRKQAGLLALVIAFNPATMLNSAAWCQIDSVLCMGLMLVAYFAMKEKWAVVLPLYVLCALIKPQALMLGFLGLAAIIMAIVRACAEKNNGPDGRKRFEHVTRSMLIGLCISVVVALAVVLPFSINQSSPTWLFELYGDTLASYPYATVNTANLFYLVDANWEAIVFDASTMVIALMTFLCLGWAVYTFLRRKERKLSWFVPAVTFLAMLAVILIALSGLSLLGAEDATADFALLSGEGLNGGVILSRGAWAVEYDQVNAEWVRVFAPDQPGAWYATVPTWLMLALATLSVAALMLLFILRKKHAWHIEWNLCEPVISLFFTQIFGMMLIFDASWTQFGIFSMALAFFLVLPMFIRSGKYENLPLCGAVIFLLLYVFGIKMHERYLFPALFLFGMAYAIKRDRRTLFLLIGTSAVLFVGEGIVLDNSIRLGSSMGHLNNDTVALAKVLSVLNVAFAVFSVWLTHRICVDTVPEKLDDTLGTPFFPAREYVYHPATPLNVPSNAKVAYGRKDALLVGVITAIYAIVTLTTLGSTKAPQNPWKSTSYEEAVYIDLGKQYDEFTMLYFAQVSYSNFSVSVCETGNDADWSAAYTAQMAQGECFRWKYLTESYLTTRSNADGSTYQERSFYATPQKLSGQYVRITADQIGLILNEVIFRDAEGNTIPATVMGAKNANSASPLYSAPENLLDEQDTLEGEPGWWNSTYFDEIYHARTAFEHLNGEAPYETSHPPLGKVIMSWFVGLFGMTPFGWRFAGALCGILMLPAMYLLVKQLTKRTDMAFVGMMLMALDCMHFTQTRIATIDSFPVLFIILSWWFMLRFMQRDIVLDDIRALLPDLALSGFFMGCGFASKWIGAYSGIGLALMYFWTCIRHLRLGYVARQMKGASAQERAMLEKRAKGSLRRVIILCLWCLLFFIVIPLAIYLLSYVPYYAYREFDGLGDYIQTVWNANFGKYNSMLSYHGTPGLGMDHPFYSPWYEWPLMSRPMYYAMDAFTPEGYSYAIFCFGNPWIWLVGLAGIGYAIYRFVMNHRYRIAGQEGTFQLRSDTWDIAPAFVLVGLLAQFLPWVLVPRGTYIYHYFASIPFLILGTVLLLDRITRNAPRKRRLIWLVYLALCLVWFILLFPYASGMLTPEWWLNFIRDYPYISLIPDYWQNQLLVNLNDFLEAIPVFPHVYH